ncbi:MAG TPA: acyl-CoA dehydrogenase family protein [Candidatus Limnocylindrales bacterium]|nr:acyl-CoA dehydrogenase family protein [Candidatus Limnocylindrales bacterium]
MPAARWRTPEVEAFRASLRAFLQKEIVPHLASWEAARRTPREFWLAMGRHGFLCPWLPEQYGGAGAEFGFSVVLCEELGRTGFMGLQTGVSVHSDITVPYLAELASEELKGRWLPGCASGHTVTAIGMTEPSVGSDLAALKTTAVRDGDHWVINGQKTFISNGIDCDLIVVACRTDPAAVPSHAGISLIVVEEGTPGFIKSRQLEKMGQHIQDTAEIFFEDCRVPATNLLGEPGRGFRYLMANLQRERLMIAIAAQTAAEQILEKTLPYVRDRKAFGRPIGSFQHNAFKIVERATEVEIGRTFLDAVIDEFEAGEDITRRVSMAKWWMSDLANAVAYDAVQLHGGYGYMNEYAVCRDYIDVRAMPIYAGSNEVMKLILARMMRLDPDIRD